MRLISWLSLCLLVLSPVSAQEPPGDPAAGGDIRDMETVVVSGAQPGPGLWKVYSGEHTLYILGRSVVGVSVVQPGAGALNEKLGERPEEPVLGRVDGHVALHAQRMGAARELLADVPSGLSGKPRHRSRCLRWRECSRHRSHRRHRA